MGIKISQLPAAGTLAGTELVPTVKGGVTEQTTTAMIAALGGAAATTIPYTPPGTGAVATTVGARNNLITYAQDFGFSAANSGAANYSALTLAIAAAAGGKLRIPAGTYAVTFSTVTGFTPPSDIVIEGDGKLETGINFTCTYVGAPTIFSQSNYGLKFKDIAINAVAVASVTPQFITWSASSLTLENCAFNGGTTNTGPTINSESYLVSAATAGTQVDLLITGCDISQFGYAFLKTNAATSIQARVKVIGNNFFNNYYEDFSPNSPAGGFSDVVVSNNNFHDPNGNAAGINQIAIGFASCTNVVVSGNTITGAFGGGTSANGGVGAIHVEQACANVVVEGNTLNISQSNCSGVLLLDNNVGGTWYGPADVVVSGNTFLQGGTVAGTIGISINYSTVPLKQINVDNNTIVNFGTGVYNGDQVVQDFVIGSNAIDSCTYGILTGEGGMKIANNETSNCSVGIYGFSGAGAIVATDHTFNNCTNNVQSASAVRPFVLFNPSFVFPIQNPGAGSTTYLNMSSAAANDRIHGFIGYTAWDTTATANTVAAEDESTWTGAAFTTTNKVSYSPGSITLTPVVNTSKFALSLFASLAQSNVRIQAHLNGMISTLV